MAVTVKDGAIVDYDYKALRLYTTADGVENSLNILANPNLAGIDDNNVAATVTEIQTTEEDGYQKITNTKLEEIAQSTASWMSTHCAGMADGTYSTADIVSAGGANANTLIGYVNSAWQNGQS